MMNSTEEIMKIFIMRHGEAAGMLGEDSLRPLTSNGLLEAEQMGKWLAGSQISLNYVIVSPYLRAQQTCASVVKSLAGSQLEPLRPSETLNFITPSGNAKQAHDFIDGLLSEETGKSNKLDDDQTLLLVSHMPFVSYLVAELTSTKQMPIFSTGTTAVIDYDIDKMQGQLLEMVSPTISKY